MRVGERRAWRMHARSKLTRQSTSSKKKTLIEKKFEKKKNNNNTALDRRASDFRRVVNVHVHVCTVHVRDVRKIPATT